MKNGTLDENATDCSGSKAVDSMFRQCPSASIKLDQINGTVSPLAKAFIDAAGLLDYPHKNLNRWRPDQVGSAFMAAQNTIDQGRRWSTYGNYLIPAMKRNNLHVLTKSFVSNVKSNALEIRLQTRLMCSFNSFRSYGKGIVQRAFSTSTLPAARGKCWSAKKSCSAQGPSRVHRFCNYLESDRLMCWNH